jgi:hypothetical protein
VADQDSDGKKPEELEPIWDPSIVIPPGENYRRIHCRNCRNELSRQCQAFTIPAGRGQLVVVVFPMVCPHCNVPMLEESSGIAMPGQGMPRGLS